MKTIQIFALAIGILAGEFYGSAQTWTQTTAPNANWAGVAMSADGTKLMAAANGTNNDYGGPIYISTNSGVDWTLTTAPSNHWTSAAESADGTILYASSGPGPIYMSSDSGSSWVVTTAPASFWWCLACSADGSRVVAGALNGTVYGSTNFGSTWTAENVEPGNHYWLSVAMSPDGNTIVAANNDDQEMDLSTNGGFSWSQLSGLYFPWISVTVSADGAKLAAAAADSNLGPFPIYCSANSGVSWAPTSSPLLRWSRIVSSADGTKLAAAVGRNFGAGVIYTSTDSGTTWISNNVPITNWISIVSSADGGRLAASCGIPGGIWTSATVQPPTINFALNNSNVTLSWPIPSTSFVLQQSPDLANWSTLTNVPVLNLTNLRNQVILPASNNSLFFRLKTP